MHIYMKGLIQLDVGKSGYNIGYLKTYISEGTIKSIYKIYRYIYDKTLRPKVVTIYGCLRHIYMRG